MALYQPSPINRRRRATRTEMEDRAEFFINYAWAHGPVTVRGLYYQAEVAGIPGIEKSDSGYRKVQTQVLNLRRAHRLPYSAIADATRIMRKPRTFDGWQAALQHTAQLYRKALWTGTGLAPEVWVEKNALAGVLYPVTSEYDVPLMCTGGYPSETFTHDAVADLEGTGATLVVLTFFDFDRSGEDACGSLREKLYRFGEEYRVPIDFRSIALNSAQVRDMALPTRPAKRGTAADRRWPYSFAAELDALPPDTLREMARDAIESFLPRHELDHLKVIEAEERRTLLQMLEAA